jgi:hypothetical protein
MHLNALPMEETMESDIQNTDKRCTWIWSVCNNASLSDSAKVVFALLATTDIAEDSKIVITNPVQNIMNGLCELACKKFIWLEIDDQKFTAQIMWRPVALYATIEIEKQSIR